MFDREQASSEATTSGLSPAYYWCQINKAENGFIVQCDGISRVYTDLDQALADLKTYLTK